MTQINHSTKFCSSYYPFTFVRFFAGSFTYTQKS